MATYSLFSHLLNGVQRQVDLSTNTILVGSVAMQGSTSGTFTQQASATTTSYSVTWPAAQASGTKILQNDGAGNLSWASGSAGTVTSVALAEGSEGASQTIFTISGSPITSSGTIDISLASQSANLVLASPNGSSGQPYFRALVSADIPSLSSIYLPLSGGTMSGAINMGSNQINNLSMAASPASTDAVNVSYVQGVLQGLSPKASVKAATIAALPSNTYSNGTAGVGATLTATANGVLVVDGYTVQLNDRILVKNESTAANNGIYYVSTLGTASVPYVLTRTLDADSSTSTPPSVESGIYTFVEPTSTTLGNTGWVLTTADPITMGTTSLNFSQFYAQGEYTFTSGVRLSGTTVSANVDNLTIDVNGSNQLEVKSGGIGTTQLAAASVTTAKLGTITDGVTLDQAGSGSTLEIKSGGVGTTQLANASVTAAKLGSVTDGITLDQSGAGSTLEIKSAGVSATQLATGAFDQKTITGGAGTAASVAYAPAVQFSGVAGQTFSANTTYAVRYGLPQNSETAGRLYACDIATSSYDLFWCVGFIQSGTSVSIGQSVSVIQSGPVTLMSSDTNFGANDPGKAIFLQSGGINASTTAPSTSGQAVAKLGIVTSTTSFLAMIASPYVY